MSVDTERPRLQGSEHPKDCHTTPPDLAYAFAELPRALFELVSLLPAHVLVSRAPAGDGQPEITLLGFRANDSSMPILRRYLGRWGYDPHPWGVGTNLGVGNDRVNYEQRFVETLETIVEHRGESATLIGQSQGGVSGRREYPPVLPSLRYGCQSGRVVRHRRQPGSVR